MNQTSKSWDEPDRDCVKFLNNSLCCQSKKTVVIFGLGRGGTSAVSGICRILGVAMPHAHPLKHEWSPVVYDGDGIDRAATSANICSMNLEHDTWGWKSPQDVFVESQYMSMLRNPHVIVVLRNPLDVLNGSTRAEETDFISSIRAVGRAYEEIFKFIWATAVPLALVNFERLRADPRFFVSVLGNWLGITPSAHQFLRANIFLTANRGEYRSLDNTGTLDEQIDPAEIALDRASAQINLYTDEIQLLDSRITALRADLETAKNIVTELHAELSVSGLSSKSLGPISREPIIANLAVPPQVPPAPEDVLMLPDYARKLSLIYYAWRECYANVSRRRMQIQNEMDALAALLGRGL